MIKKAALITLSALMLVSLAAQNLGTFSGTSASSNQETYDYRYIVELYDAGDSLDLADEIGYFYAQYPDSAYKPYLRYIEANLEMEREHYADAIRIYEELLDTPLTQDVMSVLILNYASCLYIFENSGKALNQLQRIDGEFPIPKVVYEANKLRAGIYYSLGQYYSAERYYRLALEAVPDDAQTRYDLFSTKLKLGKDIQAWEMLDYEALGSEYGELYVSTWLQYLLNNDRPADFDAFIVESIPPAIASQTSIKELRIRRAFGSQNYAQAQSLLSELPSENTFTVYYRGLLLVQQGKGDVADSLFKHIVQHETGEIAEAAYLERLKILYETDPDAAIQQLDEYLQTSLSEILKAEAYYTLAHFQYHRERYQEVLKQLGKARQFSSYPELSSRIDILLAEAWFKMERWDMALESYNRYLNLYPQGLAADTALFRTGFIQFEHKNYQEAQVALQRVLRDHPDSGYYYDAAFYLGEIEFFVANYVQALEFYQQILHSASREQPILMRIAQSYYYLGDYTDALEYIAGLEPSYESHILIGVINFALKKFEQALQQFAMAEKTTPEPLLKKEASSYRALCLYQMKNYKEASELYLSLSSGEETPDTYLFLSAKSAYAAQDYHQALALYDSFIDQYPQSRYFYHALSDIANAHYNMGNYDQAVEDYLNLLVQFRNTRDFSEEETGIVRSTLLGLELGMKKVGDPDLTDRLLMMPETFMSQFISFELNLLILKLYYDAEEWTELLSAAEELRTRYPERKPQDLQMMMVSALINLGEYTHADSLLSDAYNAEASSDVLIKWAELEELTGAYSSALEKYQEAFRKDRKAETFIRILECSQAAEFLDFEELWALGNAPEQHLGEALIIRLNYYFSQARYDEAALLADEIIAANLSAHDHALAFLTKGLIAFSREDFPATIALMKRVIVLFPDYLEVRGKAAYHLVKAYIGLGAKTEAETLLTLYQGFMSPAEVVDLDKQIGELP